MLKWSKPHKKSPMRFPLLLFLTFGPTPLLYAAPKASKAAQPPPPAGKPATFSQFIEWLVSLGKKAEEGDVPYTGQLAELLGLPQGAVGRGGGVIQEKADDYLGHNCEVILDTSGSNSIPKPLAVILHTRNSIPGFATEQYFYRLSPQGKLEKAIAVRGKIDEQDNAVPGSGEATVLDIEGPETKYRFQHELDFWLKGMYRRGKQDGKPPKPAPATR